MIGRTVLMIVVLGLLIDGGSPSGDAAFRRGDYPQAAAEYRRALESDPASAVLHYNLATTLLHMQQFEEAARHLMLVASANRPTVRRDAQFNRGNSSLFPALAMPPSPERDERLRTAIQAYREALLLDSADLDAKWNLELAELLLSRTPPPAVGGGAGGGGANGDPAPAQPDPSLADGAGPQPRMTAEQAEELLDAAADLDRRLQQEKLRRADAPAPGVRDW